ncbi:Eukaryotic translation initiation factor 5A-2 [Hibiscus syriacus]|uniref:Eukaryotic translation initiation factor 5A-2 n=1 Tax=Hibiscus syriacus TaxID=106335 RepID=A0A6A2YC06_HIBSY|nr:Eukaryotic translation initiation factor 5A-2 [Hibiscus syriacus]
MSDEEHHFESKADAGASKTYPQQAGTIRKNGYIVIKNRPCKVVEVPPPRPGSMDMLSVILSQSTSSLLRSLKIFLLTDSGDTKDDLRLPTDESLLKQIKDGFAEGKDLVVSVMSAMGEEQICALKDIGPK